MRICRSRAMMCGGADRGELPRRTTVGTASHQPEAGAGRSGRKHNDRRKRARMPVVGRTAEAGVDPTNGISGDRIAGGSTCGRV